MIKVTYGELSNLRELPGRPGVLYRLGNTTYDSFASKWLVSRFLKIVVEAVQEYEKSLMGLGQTYGEISPQNPDAFTVKPENLTTFNTELKKLQAIEVELAFLPLPVKVIEQAPLTPFDLNVLEAFIDLGSMTTPRDPKSSLVPV